MRVTQGAFSFLPDLTDAADLARRSNTACDKDWAVSVEFTDDPHPRNTYWEMWGMPMFDLQRRRRRHGGGARLPRGQSRTATSSSAPSIRRADGKQCACRSSSSARPTSPASGSSGSKRKAAPSATRCAPTPSTGRPAGVTGQTRQIRLAGDNERSRTRSRLRCRRRRGRRSQDAARQDRYCRAHRRTRSRARRARAGQAAHPRDRGVAAGRRARASRSGSPPGRRRCTWRSPAIPAPARRRWRCAWPASCIASATCAKAIWSR